MTRQMLAASPLEEAAAAALLALAEAGAMIVVGREHGPAAECLRKFPEAGLTAPGIATRFAVADGVRLAGRRVVTVLDSQTRDLAMAVGSIHPNVLLTASATHLAAARDVGITVVQPGWPDDVEPLLRAALMAPELMLLRLHRQPVDVPHPRDRPLLGTHRVLRRGPDGLLVGAGAGIPTLVEVAAVLAARGIRVTALETHTIRRGIGIDPARTSSALLVGPHAVEHARDLLPVPFGPEPRDELAQRIELALSRR